MTGLLAILQSAALRTDLRDMHVVQQPIEQRRGERRIIGERRGPLRDRQVAGHDRAGTFITLGDEVEAPVRLLAAKGQITEFVLYVTCHINRRLRHAQNHRHRASGPVHAADDRSINNSTVFTTQLPLAHWTEVIGDPVIADAIRDRLEHAAHTINITGESYRSVKARKVAAKEKDASMSTSTAPPETRARRVLNSEIGWVQSRK